MTNKEALVATLQVSIPDSSLELALINSEIDGAGTYTKENQSAIEVCAIPLLYGLFTSPDISEGDYSIKNSDLKKIKERLLYLAKKNDQTDILEQLEEKKPSVTSKNVW